MIMKYNFKGTGGSNFKISTLKNIMDFIHAYNDASARIGSKKEAEILAELKGYEPAVASRILNAIKVQFGGVPSRADESQFMRDYYNYMKSTYDAQRAKVEHARKVCNEDKKYKAPNGATYTSSELAKNGEKARKKASRFRWAKFALIAVGAIAGSYLLPLVLVNVFAGVASVSAISAISMIGSIAGLIGGGILGNRIANANGRKDRYLANKELAKYWQEVQENVNQEQAELQAEEDKLRAIEKDFGLKLDEVTSTMGSEEFNNLYNEYANEPLRTGGMEIGAGIPAGESEHAFEDEADPSHKPLEQEPEQEKEHTPEVEGQEPEAEATLEEEPAEPIDWEAGEDKTPKAEEQEPEQELEQGEEHNPEVEEEEPKTGATPGNEPSEPETEGEEEKEPELGEEHTPEILEEIQEPEQEEGDEEPITDEQKAKAISTLNGRFTKAINVCSSVGRYMLVDLREAVSDEIRKADTTAEVKEIVDNTIPEVAKIKSDYVRYEANKTGNNITGKNGTFMQELSAEKMGEKAQETELPDDYLSKNSGQTFFSAVASTYIRQNENLIKAYTRAKYADMTPAQRKANAKELYTKAEEIANTGLSFEEIDQKAEEFQQELASAISTIKVESLLEKDDTEELDKTNAKRTIKKVGSAKTQTAEEDEATL